MGKEILSHVNTRVESATDENSALKAWMQERYRNDWYSSLKLLVAREMLLWWRDKTQIRARVLQGECRKCAGFGETYNGLHTLYRSGNGNCRRNLVLARER